MIAAAQHAGLGTFLYEALVTFKRELAFVETRRRSISMTMTYGEALQRTGALARRLADAGVGPGARVALLGTNQAAWLITATAVFWCGGTLVPLDARLSPEEQAALLTRAQPVLLVAEPGLLQALPALPEGCTAWPLELPAPDVAEEDWPPRAEVRREDVAAWVYSSGTGGPPQCCQLTHDCYLSQWSYLSGLYPLQPGDRWLSILPSNHAIDFMCGFIGPLGCGAAVVHPRALRPELIQWTLQNCQITHMAAVPRLLEALLRAVETRVAALPRWQQVALETAIAANARLTVQRPRPALSRRLLAPVHAAFGGHLRVIFCGGAFTPPALAQRLYDLGIPVAIGYGLTEACTVVTVNDLAPFRADTVGRPLPGIQVRIHDPDADGVGEVQVLGATVMRGYTDPARSVEMFTPDGWLRTGDRGSLDAAGHLTLAGRSKNIIVTAGGKNISPETVEQHLGALPLEELAVYAAGFLWRERLGTVEEALVAVVRPGGTDTATLEAHLAAQNRTLPAAHRLSGWIAWEAPFPRTASLKLQRERLAEAVRAATVSYHPL